MADIVRVFLSECARRKVEPYYGFVESVHVGEIHCDLDFAPLPTVRLMVHALNAAASPAAFASRAVVHGDDASLILTKLSLQLGVNRNKLHPPSQSNALVSYAKLASRYEPNRPDVLFKNCGSLLGNGVAASSGSTASTAGSAVTRLLSGYAACVRSHGSTLHTVRLRGIQLCQSATRPRVLEPHHKAAAAAASSSPVASLGISRLAAALPYALKLAVLDLTDSNIGDVNAIRLVSSVAQLPYLREVYLAGCALTDASADALVMLVQCSVPKRSTAAFKTTLRGSGGGTSPQPLRSHGNPPAAGDVGLSVLGLSRNAIGDRFLARFSDVVQHDESLHSLLFDHNAPTTKGLLRLVNGLTDAAASGTSALSFVDLSGNGGVDIDALLAPLDTLSLVAGFVVSTGHGGSEHQFTISRDVVASSANVMCGSGGGVGMTRGPPMPVLQHGGAKETVSSHPHHRRHRDGLHDAAHHRRHHDAASDSAPAAARRTHRGHQPPAPYAATRRNDDDYRVEDGAAEEHTGAYHTAASPRPVSPASAARSPHTDGRSPSSRSPQRSRDDRGPSAAADDGAPKRTGPHAHNPYPSFGCPWPPCLPPGAPSTAGGGGQQVHSGGYPMMVPVMMMMCLGGDGGVPGGMWPTWWGSKPNVGPQAADSENQTSLQGGTGAAADADPQPPPVTVDDLLLDEGDEGAKAAVAGSTSGADSLVPTSTTPEPGAREVTEAPLDGKHHEGATASEALLAMQQMLEVHEEATRMQVEGVRSDLAATNHRVEDLAGTMHSALSTVQRTSLELEHERRVFQEAEAYREQWAAMHPEEVIERDVVELIQAGIERIRHHMTTDDSPPPKGGRPSSTASASAPTRGGAPPSLGAAGSAGASQKTPLGATAITNVLGRGGSGASPKGADGSAAAAGVGSDTFLSDVKAKLTSLGW